MTRARPRPHHPSSAANAIHSRSPRRHRREKPLQSMYYTIRRVVCIVDRAVYREIIRDLKTEVKSHFLCRHSAILQYTGLNRAWKIFESQNQSFTQPEQPPDCSISVITVGVAESVLLENKNHKTNAPFGRFGRSGKSILRSLPFSVLNPDQPISIMVGTLNNLNLPPHSQPSSGLSERGWVVMAILITLYTFPLELEGQHFHLQGRSMAWQRPKH